MDSEGCKYQKHNRYAVEQTRERIAEIEKQLSEYSTSLEDILRVAAKFDVQQNGSVLDEVLKDRLEHTLNKKGLFELYEEFPILKTAYQEAYEVPHWIVC